MPKHSVICERLLICEALCAGVVGGVVGLGLLLGLATWLVMRSRQINNSGSSDEESPYGHKDHDGYGGARGLHASEWTSALFCLSRYVMCQHCGPVQRQ